MKSDVLNYKLINNVLNEFLDGHTRQVLTEDQKRTIRNKILRCVLAITKKEGLLVDGSSQEVQNAVDEVWNNYVKHPIEGENRQNDEITVINQNIERLIPYVVSVSEYDDSIMVNKNLRLKKSFEELIQAQRQNRQTQLWQNNQRLTHWSSKKHYDDELNKKKEPIESDNHYTIYKINDYDSPIEGLGMTVTELGKYTGGQGAVPLCYTQTESTYNNYTSNNRNQMYALLRDGWQDEPCEIGKDYPLDSYGLSMIFVITSPTGAIQYSNVRWNHGPKRYSRSVDNIFDYNELRKIVGDNVMIQIGLQAAKDLSVQLTYEVEEKLSQNYGLSDIFDSVNTHFYDGWRVVEIKDKYNFIDKENNLISDVWFDDVYNFSDGYAAIAIRSKWNILRSDSTFVWDKEDIEEWFDGLGDECGRFDERGTTIVTKIYDNEEVYNLLRTNGTLIWNKQENEWFTSIENFDDNYLEVSHYGDYNLLSFDGKLISKQWYEKIGHFHDGIARVMLDNVYNFMRLDGTLVWGDEKASYDTYQWFDAASHFENGLAVVGEIGRSGYKYNIITKEGKLLWRPEDTKNTDKWFDWLDCQCSKYGFYPVSIYDFKGDNYNNCYNILKSDGTFVFDENVSKDEIRIKAQQMVQDIKKQRNSIQESLNRYLSNNLLKIRY